MLVAACGILTYGFAIVAIAETGSDEKPLRVEVSSFELVGQTIYGGLTRLMDEPSALSFGFEAELKARFADPENADVRFNLSLKNWSIKEILGLCYKLSRSRGTKTHLATSGSHRV